MKNVKLYVAREERNDIEDLIVTYNREEAEEKASYKLSHLTVAEKEKTSVYVAVYDVAAEDDVSAQQLYDKLIDNDELPGDYDLIQVI